jgi:uncharacterized protein (DUF433 family)
MKLTGIGLYTLQEAERLTGAQAREVSRWLFGYTFKGGVGAPLWTPQLASLDAKVIGFRDLMELRIVKALRDHNVPLRVIRAAIDGAKAIFGIEYPCTTHRFLIDGKSIFSKALQEHGAAEMPDLAKRHLVFERIVRPALYAGIEFADNGQATRWFPVKRSKAIVLDPEIAFGKPVLTDYGVRTEIVAEAFKAEKDKKMVASLFDVSVAAVEAAIRYEWTAV